MSITKKLLPILIYNFFIILVSCNNVFALEESKHKSAEIDGITKWFNSKPLKISDQKGKVVLVDFWTYSCINCIRTLPHMNALQEKYGDKGLVIIGVHAPEFDFEKDEQNVAAAIKRFGIKYPVAMDNNRKTWDNFENRYWPAHYLIDQQGNVVYHHFGEGAYDVMDNNIRELLKISKNSSQIKKEDISASSKETPETYLGFDRAARNSNENKKNFVFPQKLDLHHWAFSGKWKILSQNSQATAAEDALRLNFYAKKVFLVMDSQDGKAINVEIKLNGNKIAQDQAGADVKDGVATIKESRLYELVATKSAAKAILEIKTSRAGLRVYAFTFG